MGNILRFPGEAQSKHGFERVKSTYSVREISKQFGLSDRYIRRWTLEGIIRAVPGGSPDEFRYDFRTLSQFRRIRELRGRGLTLRQIDAELHGQLNLFPQSRSRIIRHPGLSSFEEALLLHEQGERQEATKCYLKAVAEDDYVADAYCNLGILEFEAGNIPRAFDCFTSSLKHDPRHFESHFNLANLYFETGDLRLARIHYQMAAEIEPSFPSLYFNLGLVHAMEGDFASSAAALDQARELAPEEEAGKVDELLASIRNALRCSS